MNKQRTEIAERLAAKATIRPTIFNENLGFQDDWYPQNLVVALTEGTIAGKARTFGFWLPITKEAYKDETFRDGIVRRSQEMLRREIVRLLIENQYIVGPRRKLPA